MKAMPGIIDCILKSEHVMFWEIPHVYANTFDGKCIVNMLPPTKYKAFVEYGKSFFVSYA